MRKTFSTTETKSSYDSFVSKRTIENFTFLSTTASIITIGLGGIFYIIGNAINPLKKDIAKIEEELKQLSNDNKIAMKEMSNDNKIAMKEIEEELKQLSNDNKIAMKEMSDDNKIAIKEMSDDNKIVMKKMDEVYVQVLRSNERLAVVETKQTLKG
jgi:hypothetical protein